jgi:uncharacterized protein
MAANTQGGTAMRSIVYSFALALALVAPTARASDDAPIPLDAPWKVTIYNFTRDHLQHSAWGLAHSVRDYLLSQELAAHEGVDVDTDVLFAAAFLHDMGGFPEFEQEGVDHAVRSAELAPALLESAGFPMEKVAAATTLMREHAYYDPAAPTTPLARVFRDADILDFLGAIGAARIISLTGHEAFAPNIGGGVRLLSSFVADLTTKLNGGTYTRELGERRRVELDTFLRALDAESVAGRAL